jgi:hypothetical protein
MKFALTARRSNTETLLLALDRSLAAAEFGSDGILLNANENFLSLTGCSLTGIRCKHHRLLFEESHGLGDDQRAFWAALNRGERQTFEQVAAMQSASDDVIGTLASIGQGIGTVQTFVSEAASVIQGQSLAAQDIAANMQDAADRAANINRCLDEWVVGLEERRRDPRVPHVPAGDDHHSEWRGPDRLRPEGHLGGGRESGAQGRRAPARPVHAAHFRRARRKNCAIVRRAGGMISMRFIQD